MPMYQCSVRLDVTVEDFAPYVPILNSISGDWYAVAETNESGENPHIHTYQVFESARTTWTGARRVIQNRFQPRLTIDELTGNGGYAISKVTDPAGWHRYMCKGSAPDYDTGRPTVAGIAEVKAQDYDDEFFRWNHGEYWKVNAERQNERQKKAKKRTTEDLVTEIIDKCKRARAANGEPINGDNRRAIAAIAIDTCCKRLKPIAVPYIRSVVNLVSCTLEHNYAKPELINRIINEY